MYLDHPVISATNSETESDRIERLNRVYGYAIARADADGNQECISKVARLHDHKGSLIVAWRVAPTAREEQFFLQAWSSLVGDGSSNVSHELEQVP